MAYPMPAPVYGAAPVNRYPGIPSAEVFAPYCDLGIFGDAYRAVEAEALTVPPVPGLAYDVWRITGDILYKIYGQRRVEPNLLMGEMRSHVAEVLRRKGVTCFGWERPCTIPCAVAYPAAQVAPMPLAQLPPRGIVDVCAREALRAAQGRGGPIDVVELTAAILQAKGVSLSQPDPSAAEVLRRCRDAVARALQSEGIPMAGWDLGPARGDGCALMLVPPPPWPPQAVRELFARFGEVVDLRWQADGVMVRFSEAEAAARAMAMDLEVINGVLVALRRVSEEPAMRPRTVEEARFAGGAGRDLDGPYRRAEYRPERVVDEAEGAQPEVASARGDEEDPETRAGLQGGVPERRRIGRPAH